MATEETVRVPTQERARRTRGALVEAAQREFSAAGYAATTAKSIAKRAGVSTGSFYQYFTDKDAILRELATERLASVTRAVRSTFQGGGAGALGREDAERGLRTIVDLVVGLHREDPGLHAVLTERRHVDAELERLTASAESAFVAEIAHLLERWSHPGDVEAVAFVLFNMVEGAVHAHVLGRAVVDDVRFTRALVGALFQVALPTATRNA